MTYKRVRIQFSATYLNCLINASLISFQAVLYTVNLWNTIKNTQKLVSSIFIIVNTLNQIKQITTSIILDIYIYISKSIVTRYSVFKGLYRNAKFKKYVGIIAFSMESHAFDKNCRYKMRKKSWI